MAELSGNERLNIKRRAQRAKVENSRSWRRKTAASRRKFADMVQEAGEKLTLSRHAKNRLDEAGIRLTPRQRFKIARAMDKLAQKGGQESLILMQKSRPAGDAGGAGDNLALIVNPDEGTVITAVEGSRMDDKVFTNIDSAVVVEEEDYTQQAEVPLALRKMTEAAKFERQV